MAQEETTVCPDFICDEYLDYLYILRERGETNMCGAASYLQRAFPELTEDESKKALIYWMKTFSGSSGD